MNEIAFTKKDIDLINKKVGILVSGYRKLKGFNKQIDFIKDLPFAISTFSNKEQGKSAFTIPELVLISKKLQVPLIEFLPKD